MNSQKYKHDHCEKCRFVCQADSELIKADVWICSGKILIARHSDDPSDYGAVRIDLFQQYQHQYTKYPYVKIWEKLAENPDWCGDYDQHTLSPTTSQAPAVYP